MSYISLFPIEIDIPLGICNGIESYIFNGSHYSIFLYLQQYIQ
jgi:hypothetical protein